MNALEIKDLCKSYDSFRLEPLSLTLPSGCIMGLIGENGAGKSTTIRLVLDLVSRDGGSVMILGKDNQKDLRLMKEDIGVVLDEVGISGCLTARQVGKIMKNTFKRWDEHAYEEHLQRFSLPKDKKFKDLSRGMKMKVGIAVALSHHAKLLILDEATSGLDPIVRDEITDLLNEFTRDESHAVLISSHILSDLEKICDYIAFLHKGRLLLCEEKDRLKELYGVVHLSFAEFQKIPQSAIVGKRETAYGTEAVVEKGALPYGIEAGQIDLEQLFLFMTKEAV